MRTTNKKKKKLFFPNTTNTNINLSAFESINCKSNETIEAVKPIDVYFGSENSQSQLLESSQSLESSQEHNLEQLDILQLNNSKIEALQKEASQNDTIENITQLNKKIENNNLFNINTVTSQTTATTATTATTTASSRAISPRAISPTSNNINDQYLKQIYPPVINISESNNNSKSIKKIPPFTNVEIKSKIDKFSENELSEVFKILRNNNEKYSTNKNGIFVNLSNLKKCSIIEICNFILFCDNNNKILEEEEQTRNVYRDIVLEN